MEYTSEQLKILEHDPTKHACILAGPGTGKSSTVISYISKIYSKESNKIIRLLTFTRAANSELVNKITEAGHEKVISSTVHSFAISILLKNPGASNLPEPLRIADDWEWNELIRRDLARKLRTTVRVVDKLKNEMSAQWESLSPEKDESISDELRGLFMGMWEEHRRLYGYTLLAELPFRLKVALEGNPELDLGGIELVCVDEYQDLNACDLKCFHLLSERGITIIAIGDDDQSIYQFRKAHPDGIRNFSKEYQAISYPLTVSQRCGNKILNWASYVIKGDTSRPPKPSLRPGKDNVEGQVGYLVFNREGKEAEGVARLTNWLINKEKIPIEEILILVRTENIGKLQKKVLGSMGIPYADPEETLGLLRDRNTRQLLCILRLIVNREDSLAWWGILNLTHGIGPEAIKEIYELARQKKCSFGKIIVKELENDFRNVSTSRNKISAQIQEINRIIEKIDLLNEGRWGSWIVDQIKNNKLPEIPDEMKTLLVKIDDFRDSIEQKGLGQYINQIEPIIKDITNSKTAGRTRIMTLSRSKGLTVRATIIVGAEDGIIPHPKGDCQEERRLLYVGMTRPREYLYITRARRRTGFTARSGQANIAGVRCPCPFLDGGPVSQQDGAKFLNQLDS